MVVIAEPRDQSARQRFATELDRNFSVVASAGSGKTRAVTDRIVQLAQSARAVDALPRLVVLTFANRAADEMQQRVREQILRAEQKAEVLDAFNRAWFGTIHAFCLKLLNDYGHYLGLPAPLELVTDDDDLWAEFVQEQTTVGRSLSLENRKALLRFASMRHIMELGRSAGSALLNPTIPCARPEPAFDELDRAALVARKTDAISRSVDQLRAWQEQYRNGSSFLRWPICFATAEAFVGEWNTAFAPLRRWVNETAICVAAEVQRDYRNFRLERGVVTYADQIALADELLQHPEAAKRLRQLDHIVILDEAQDTDPAQFSVLLELTRPPEAKGRWLQTKSDPPRPGSFCMVGDFQQSIYHDRADLAQYRRVHDLLVQSEAGDPLTFSVTFRLDQRQLDFVNATFSEILHGSGGQVEFVELQPRPQVLPGQVIRLSLPRKLRDDLGDKPKERQIARAEARELARWLKTNGITKLRARSWREVAVLCPRRDWLRTMALALREVDLPFEVQSESDLQADSPAYAWLTALCTIMVEPRNHYEIAGVLREVYGISDHDLAIFSEGIGARFQIEQPITAAGIVSSQLAELATIRSSLRELPLFAAVEELIQRTALGARIGSLPEEDFKQPLADLDTLLTLAAESGARGDTLADFADRLRSEMERQRPVRLSEENAIQLITAQKAKGSEWDAVIIPFLSRRIIPPSPRYPSIIKVPGKDEVIAALHKEDREDEVKEVLKTLQRQEMERLLYVAVTRARHTLVLAHDRELFCNAKEQVADNSQLRFLRADTRETSVETLMALPDECVDCAETAASWANTAAGQSTLPAPAPLEIAKLERARRNASVFIRKQNPSGYDEPLEPATDSAVAKTPRPLPRSIADTPATLYGSWWHTLFEHFPWKADPSRWQEAFEALQSSSPDPERSAREWQQLRTTLGDSPAAQFLRRPGTIVHTELPFLWRIDEQSCLEGVIDLLAIDRAEKRCLLVDWKTNRLTSDQEDGLRARYLSQIAAYWTAVGEMTQFEIEAGLFSTSVGRWLIYTDKELRTEWTRLCELRPDERSTAISPADA